MPNLPATSSSFVVVAVAVLVGFGVVIVGCGRLPGRRRPSNGRASGPRARSGGHGATVGVVIGGLSRGRARVLETETTPKSSVKVLDRTVAVDGLDETGHTVGADLGLASRSDHVLDRVIAGAAVLDPDQITVLAQPLQQLVGLIERGVRLGVGTLEVALKLRLGEVAARQGDDGDDEGIETDVCRLRLGRGDSGRRQDTVLVTKLFRKNGGQRVRFG